MRVSLGYRARLKPSRYVRFLYGAAGFSRTSVVSAFSRTSVLHR